MGQNRNIGQKNSLVVYGDVNYFDALIDNHGQPCKIKQGLFCPCVVKNHGSPDQECPICAGNGFIYTYQRRFLIADENSPRNHNVTEIYPFYIPIKEVIKVERITSSIQGGILEMEVESFTDDTIFIKNDICAKNYDRLRVTYFYDGWTHVTDDILTVDEEHGLMWPTKTYFDTGYQSSNPLRAEADISQINRIWNSVTGVELTNYTRIGNTIKTKEPIVSGQMVADYYYADLTSIITADLKTQDDLEKWTNDLESGNIRLALHSWYNIAKGDMIVIAADTMYKTELLTLRGTQDMLWQVEIFELNDVCIDEDGVLYYRKTDYELLGNRFMTWVSSHKPADGKTISIKYGFKPSFLIFQDNPENNSLESRRYPKVVFAKSYSKTSVQDITKLLTAEA